MPTLRINGVPVRSITKAGETFVALADVMTAMQGLRMDEEPPPAQLHPEGPLSDFDQKLMTALNYNPKQNKKPN